MAISTLSIAGCQVFIAPLLPLQELRQMVINGCDKHPGAVAVETETGWVQSLSMMNQQVGLTLQAFVQE